MKRFQREFFLFLGIVITGCCMLYYGANHTLDRKFYYTQEEGMNLLRSKSSVELFNYNVHLNLDFIYLIFYSALFASILNRLYLSKKIIWLAFIPGILDIVEDVVTKLYLHQQMIEIPPWLGIVTCAKWISAYGLIGMIVVTVIYRMTPRGNS